MIVETMNNNGCTCHISDDAYRDKTPEEVNRIVRSFSDFIVGRLKDLKEKTAQAVKVRQALNKVIQGFKQDLYKIRKEIEHEKKEKNERSDAECTADLSVLLHGSSFDVSPLALYWVLMKAMREQGIKRYKRRKQMAYKVFCWILGILVALIGVSVIGFWVVIFITFYQREGEKVQSMKEKWLGFATDENVVRALKDIRRVAAKHGIRHVSVQILDGDVYGYTNDAAAGPYNLEIGTSGLRVEAGQAQYFKSI